MTAYQDSFFRILSSLRFSVHYLHIRIVFFQCAKNKWFQNMTFLCIIQQN